MNAIKSRFVLFLALVMALFAVSASAGVPQHITARRLAPNHAIDLGAGRAELAQLRAAATPGLTSKPKAAAAAGPIRNVYFTPSPDGAFASMARRLQSKDPVSVSAKQFAERGDSVGASAPTAVAEGKVVARVYRARGVLELQFANRTEALSLEMAAVKAIDNAHMKKTLDATLSAFYKGTNRPDRVVQAKDGSFTVLAGDTPIHVIPIGTGEADNHSPGRERMVERPESPLPSGGRAKASVKPIMTEL